ncbi:MAG: DUF3566 domain-containing protein [Actinomycetota bacterium]|nr:DUF3566 domain-containing protein [Actinomycetota bacterium]
MTTTAEDPITEKPTTDPTIDVELPTSSVPRRTTSPRPLTRPGSRRTRVTVRRFGLLSVFKFSLIFSFCVMVVVWLALMLIYFMLDAAGVTNTIAYWIGCVIKEPDRTNSCTAAGIDAVKLFTWLFGGGLIMATAASILWTFVALIYNLISDIVGGVEVVLAEKRA